MSTFLNEIIQTIADRGRTFLDIRPAKGTAGLESTIEACRSLLSQRGEASGVALAQDILRDYSRFSPDDRIAFFRHLRDDFGADPKALFEAAERYAKTRSEEDAAILHEVAEPRRQELIRRLNLAPGGTAALVSMREDLIGRLNAEPSLRVVDTDFGHLFSSWFNRGFLVIRRIDWQTPAAVLERIIRYEAVHAIKDWDDLRRRIDPPDRRLYAFFHPTLTDDPLIFVEVALTPGIPGAIEPILSASREPLPPAQATTAVFYSISNCHAGLRGVSFGSFLIKQVVAELCRELPKLKTFVTLSPVPGFRAWLERTGREGRTGTLSETELEKALALAEGGSPELLKDEALKTKLTALAAHYLIREKASRNQPLDPVARFHLGNGARLERVNWAADLSPNGLSRACGLMVNYLYDPQEIEPSHEAYVTRGVVSASPAVQKLVKSVSEPKQLALTS